MGFLGILVTLMDLATIDDFASEAGISRETIYGLIRRHGLQTYKQVGDRRTYIDRDEIRPLLGPQPKRSRAHDPR